MLSHGFTEIIKHFAGYMRIFDDAERARAQVSGEPEFLQLTLAPEAEFEAAQSTSVNLEDYASRASFLRIPAVNDENGNVDPFYVRYRPLEDLPRPGQNFTSFDEADLEAAAAARFQRAIGTIIPEVHITYQEGGEQILALLQQINAVYDNDVLHLGEWEGDLPARLVADLEALTAMAAEATAGEVPDDLIPTDLTPEGLSEWFAQKVDAAKAELQAAQEAQANAAKDGEGAEAQDAATDGPLQNVVYIDGVANGEADIGKEDFLALVEERVEADANGEFTAGVSVGGNTAFNAAQITDLHNTSFSVLVKGDSYTFDAIVQLNVSFSDAFGQGEGDYGWSHWFAWNEGDESPGATFADNIASFTTSGQLVTAIAGFSQVANLNWTVDVFEGDFLDITLIQQLNLLSDDDTITGLFESQGWNIEAGGNLSLNLAQFLSLDLSYDLIIIDGSYYEANVIFQQNILLDGDWAQNVEGTGSDNILRNEAEIMHYGNTAYMVVPDHMATLYDRIASGETDFTLEYGLTEVLPNASTNLSVLYIKGDYYNVNIIEQTNIVSDADILIAEDDTLVGTSGNVLGNEALIVSGGGLSTQQYLEGEQYEDSLLVQASIVTNEADPLERGSDNLVNEVIAFIDHDTDWQRGYDNTEDGAVYVPQDDVMASVLV